MAALKNVFSNRHMVHFGHQKNLRYKKVNTFFFSSKIFLPLNDHQLSIKEYNENVTDVSFVKGLIDTKTIQNMHYKLIACWRNSAGSMASFNAASSISRLRIISNGLFLLVFCCLLGSLSTLFKANKINIVSCT